MALRSLFERMRSRADADRGLHAYLSETFSAWPFTDAAVEISPAAPGVYFLSRSGRLIYIGVAISGSGIRQELASHRRGAYGGCTREASAFFYELASEPLSLYRRYLNAHKERYGNRLPQCNEREFTAAR
jgi:hypothetical protein